MNRDRYVDLQAAGATELVADFVASFTDKVDAAEAELAAYLDKIVDADADDDVDPTPRNLIVLSMLPLMFDKALTAAGVYEASALFISALAKKEIDASKAAYIAMASQGSGFPRQLSSLAEYADALVKVGGLLQEMVEAHIDAAKNILVSFVGRSLGGGSLEHIRAAVGRAFAKLRKLGDLPMDMVMSFYRLALMLLFIVLENDDEIALFEYVGVRDNRNREFCAHELDIGGQYTLDQINGMDNGQGLPVFENGGGYGCRHWWWAVRVVRRRDL